MMTCDFIIAWSCDFYYDIQPGPTTETCNLTTVGYLELLCQVSSNSTRDFHINWHYSPLSPDNNTINSSISQLSLQFENKFDSEILSMDTYVVSSTLTITGFNVTGNGFYWCSVSSTSNTIHTPNPSTIVRLWHQNECQGKCHSKIVSLHKQSNRSHTTRCADQGVNVTITEAQTCSQVSTTWINTRSSTNSESDSPTIVISAPNSTMLSTISFISIPTATILNNYSNPASKNNTWIAIGTSTGGVILIFYCIVGAIITCAMYRKRRGQYKLNDPLSPFDVIHMDTSTSVLQEEDSNKYRISKILFEANISYECTHTVVSQSDENIYATIQ